jgi:hypothetical protein
MPELNFPYKKFDALLQEADEDFRTDVAYAVAVAKAARSLAARRKRIPAVELDSE